jgi:hypothetical protein
MRLRIDLLAKNRWQDASPGSDLGWTSAQLLRPGQRGRAPHLESRSGWLGG